MNISELLKPNDIEPIEFDIQKLRNHTGIISVVRDLRLLLEQYGDAKLFGGSVRDAILGIDNTSDYDFFTSINRDTILNELKKTNTSWELKLNEIVVRFILNNSYEIDIRTSAEKDIGLYADFTINAITVDQNMEVIDDVNGITDLEARKLVYCQSIIPNVETKFANIIRAIRMMCQKGMWTDSDTWEQSVEASLFFDSPKSDIYFYQKKDKMIGKLMFLTTLNRLQRERALGLFGTLNSNRLDQLVQEIINSG